MEDMNQEDRQFIVEQLGALRGEMATKADVASLKADLESLSDDLVSLGQAVASQFELVATKADLARVEEKVEQVLRLDFQSQIDRLRDDVRLLKTKAGLA
jgi:hypothetical protein